jgi:Holliday junction resolvase RusA-like endonuclease
MIIKLKPLSINSAYQGRRFKNKAHKDYEQELLWLLKGQKKVKGFYSISFLFHVKNFAMTDISNLVKVTEDCIVKAGLVEDDRKCIEMHLKKIRSKEDYFSFMIKPVKE